MEEKKQTKISLGALIAIIVIVLILIVGAGCLIKNKINNEQALANESVNNQAINNNNKKMSKEEELKIYLSKFAVLNSTDSEEYDDNSTVLRVTTGLINSFNSNSELYNVKGEIDKYIKSFYYEPKVKEILKRLKEPDEGELYRYDEANDKYGFFDSFGEAGNPMAICTSVSNIEYENGTYTIAFTYEFSEDWIFAQREMKNEYDEKDIKLYKRTIKLKENKNTQYSKYKIISLSKPTLVENENNKVKISYKINPISPEDKIIDTLTINGVDVTNKIGESLIGDEVTAQEEEEFAIININRYTTENTNYDLYIFDYSGNILFKDDIDNVDYLFYSGEYKYNSEEKTLQYVEKRGVVMEDSYRIPEISEMYVSENELFKMDKEKLKTINKAKIYEIKYQANGKFSNPEVIKTIKFNPYNVYGDYNEKLLRDEKYEYEFADELTDKFREAYNYFEEPNAYFGTLYMRSSSLEEEDGKVYYASYQFESYEEMINYLKGIMSEELINKKQSISKEHYIEKDGKLYCEDFGKGGAYDYTDTTIENIELVTKNKIKATGRVELAFDNNKEYKEVELTFEKQGQNWIITEYK